MKIHFLAVATLALASSTFVHAQAIWTSGHGDIGVGFHEGELEPHWHLGEEGEEVVVDGVTLSNPLGFEYETADLIARTGNSFLRPAGSQWSFLGVNAGETVYYFGATETPGTPYIGFATEELSASEWGPITFTLAGVTGPGQFAIYDLDPFGAPTVLMSTFDAGADTFALNPETHTHFSIAFSEVGTYAVTFDISGTQTLGGISTNHTATATYTFNVVPEPGSAALLLMAGAGLLLRRRTRQF